MTTVAMVIDSTRGQIYDECYTWEAGQTYAAQGYVVMAVADDEHMSQVDAQSLYDHELALVLDCYGLEYGETL